MTRQVLIGEIGRAHGIRGEVRLRAFTARPLDLGTYGPLTTDKGCVLTIASLREAGEGLIGRIEGVADRNAAEALKGARLFVDRAKLPEAEDEDEVLAADLVGLTLVDRDGRTVGEVVGVANYGAGDILDVKVEGRRGTVMLPFTDDVVVAIEADRIVVEAGPGSVAAQFLEADAKPARREDAA